MNTGSPLPTHIAYEVGYLNDRELVNWAVGYLPTSEYFSEDLDLIELVSINEKQAREIEKAGDILSKFIIRQWPEFQLSGSKSEHYAKKFFYERLREYLEGGCRLYDVCRMISPIEQIFDFPDWLGNMYNACDWIEPDSKPVNCRYLESEIEQVLNL